MTKAKPYPLESEQQRETVLRLISGLNLDKPWRVTIERKPNRRSLSQNNLYWKWVENVVKAVHEHTGQDKDDIHEFFKQKFLTPKVIEIAGEVIYRYSTKGLEKHEMKDYMDKIYAFCVSELGILLPLPEEMHLDQERGQQ